MVYFIGKLNLCFKNSNIFFFNFDKAEIGFPTWLKASIAIEASADSAWCARAVLPSTAAPSLGKQHLFVRKSK